MSFQEILHHPITAGAVSGIVTAAAVDLHAFRSWKSFHEAAAYDWQLAAWRWFQGGVTGAIGAAGYDWMIQ